MKIVINTSTICIASHYSKDTVLKLKRQVNEVFDGDEEYFNSLTLEEYREFMIHLQTRMDDDEMGRKIVESIQPVLFQYLNTDSILIQSNIYLRASRPIKNQDTENIGWHRETFYGSNMQKSINIWTPIRGVTEKNTLRYIPESQNIPEEEIMVTQQESDTTKRFSKGHKLGFLYSPKVITRGVDLSQNKAMIVKEGKSSIFSGNLIHGNAENNGSQIRFSVDFRLIRKSDYSSVNKQSSFSSGKPYFVEY